jgi:hypothetical protein
VQLGKEPRLERQIVVTGALVGGGELAQLDDAGLARLCHASSGRHVFRFASGALVSGRFERSVRASDERLRKIELSAARLELPGRAPLELPRYVLLAAGDVIGAQAGAVDGAYHPDTEFSLTRVPKPRVLPERERALLGLYEQAAGAHAEGAAALTQAFPRIAAGLERDSPDEWLLRWNLLESLLKVGPAGALGNQLRAELERLERKFERREPIASGLRYLSRFSA